MVGWTSEIPLEKLQGALLLHTRAPSAPGQFDLHLTWQLVSASDATAVSRVLHNSPVNHGAEWNVALVVVG